MLFNSYAFIFAFLPFTLLGFALVGRVNSRPATLSWLIVCSMAFYGLWNPLSLAIILPSIAINYLLARWMQRRMAVGGAEAAGVSAVLALGIAFNVCFLGYFKYKNFFLESSNLLLGSDFPLLATILPLGISFITFQKIAFLVDVRVGAIKDFDAFDFLIFVFFFPQLIAGPIVHYREMVPQFTAVSSRLQSRHLAVGLALFALGLFKKAVLADGIAPYANGVFDAADAGHPPGFVNGWLGALAYMLQIYFDFSGYSDMALGLARMFGIQLPANFNSPLKASSMIDFWNRWHLTLTRFLTAYAYTPLVMSLTRSRMAKGKPVMSRNNASLGAFAVLVATPTMTTMFISGFWHGAGATFIVWGLLHGLLLVINHAWRQWRPKWDKATYERWMKPIGFCLTFTAVVVVEVLFRAKSMGGALSMFGSMAGADGLSLPLSVLSRLGGAGQWLAEWGVRGDASSGAAFQSMTLWVLALFVVVTCLPNSLEVMQKFEPALHFRVTPATPRRFVVQLSPRWAAGLSVLMLFGLLSLNRISQFLYWQF
jgi:alginate O-acetyltransferase complex protein AlgI